MVNISEPMSNQQYSADNLILPPVLAPNAVAQGDPQDGYGSGS